LQKSANLDSLRIGENLRRTAMSERATGQLSFADSLASVRRDGALDRVEALLDWSAVRSILAPVRKKLGAPGYRALMMFRCLLLGLWHDLADPALEAALADRFSFRRFAGLSIAEAVPDHSTLWRFRERLTELGLAETLFSEINRQLEAKGLIVKTGTLIDASFVAAAAKPPAKPPAKPKQGEEPKASADPDARWGKKGKTSVFGYKMHIGVDAAHTLIRKAALGHAGQTDTERADELVSGDEAAVYGDKAYYTHARHAALRAKRIRPLLMRRPNKHHPKLKQSQKRFNRLIAKVRFAVERPFAVFKTHMGFRRMRFFSFARNQTHFLLGCCAYNLRRAANALAAAS
jgi:IS5 family transposase